MTATAWAELRRQLRNERDMRLIAATDYERLANPTLAGSYRREAKVLTDTLDRMTTILHRRRRR